MKTLQIIQTIEDGIPGLPSVFYDPAKALRYFEALLTDQSVGFRPLNEYESAEQYRQAFHDWYHEDHQEKVFDTDDWEIHWFEESPKDEPLLCQTRFPDVIYPFFGFKTHPCKMDAENNVVQCLHTEAEFYGAYLVGEENRLFHLADFVDQSSAQHFVNWIRGIVLFNEIN